MNHLDQKLDFSFFESFIYNKNWCFLQVLIPIVVFSMKAITENQLHGFLINNRILARNIVYTIPHYGELQSP